MLAQFKKSPKVTDSTPQPTVPTGTQVHDRTEALALMEELAKRQRPFEKLRLAQAHEEKYREEAQSVEALLETLESIALTERKQALYHQKTESF